MAGGLRRFCLRLNATAELRQFYCRLRSRLEGQFVNKRFCVYAGACWVIRTPTQTPYRTASRVHAPRAFNAFWSFFPLVPGFSIGLRESPEGEGWVDFACMVVLMKTCFVLVIILYSPFLDFSLSPTEAGGLCSIHTASSFIMGLVKSIVSEP